LQRLEKVQNLYGDFLRSFKQLEKDKSLASIIKFLVESKSLSVQKESKKIELLDTDHELTPVHKKIDKLIDLGSTKCKEYLDKEFFNRIQNKTACLSEFIRDCRDNETSGIFEAKTCENLLKNYTKKQRNSIL
jgi:hypothetical protein